jgi:hypothetical protein
LDGANKGKGLASLYRTRLLFNGSMHLIGAYNELRRRHRIPRSGATIEHDELYEVRFGLTGRTHVSIFAYMIDDLDACLGWSIRNTGKWKGVMAFEFINCNIGIP